MTLWVIDPNSGVKLAFGEKLLARFAYNSGQEHLQAPASTVALRTP